MKKYAYLTLFTKNNKGEYEYLIGLKKFMNINDGYIGTNPYQYVIPGGNIMEIENDQTCAVREFEEETGHNLYDLGSQNLIKIFSNKYASFFIAFIPYQNKDSFIYSKDTIIESGHYPEFEKFEWVKLPKAINKFQKKIDVDKLLIIYFDNLNNFINKGKPIWVNSNQYQMLKNNDINHELRISLKKYIKRRLDNGWFIDMFKEIQKKY